MLFLAAFLASAQVEADRQTGEFPFFAEAAQKVVLIRLRE